MAKREHCGVYQMRFGNLLAAMVMTDAKKAGELSPSMVSGIIGCSENYAYTLIKGWLSG